jgi:hypothetical protein
MIVPAELNEVVVSAILSEDGLPLLSDWWLRRPLH